MNNKQSDTSSRGQNTSLESLQYTSVTEPEVSAKIIPKTDTNSAKKPSSWRRRGILAFLALVLLFAIGGAGLQFKHSLQSNASSQDVLGGYKSSNSPVLGNDTQTPIQSLLDDRVSINGNLVLNGDVTLSAAAAGSIAGAIKSVLLGPVVNPVQQTGSINLAGQITASSFQGNGAALGNLNANSITSGTLSNDRLDSSVTRLGQSIPLSALQGAVITSVNGVTSSSGNVDLVAGAGVTITPDTVNKTITITSTAAANNGDITSVIAGTGLTGGGVAGDVTIDLDAGVVTLQGNNFNGASQLVKLDNLGRLTALDGSQLVSLNASNIASGTLNDSRLSNNITIQGNTFNVANKLVQLDGSGALPILSGSNLTNLNASNIASGTLNDSRLSNNVTIQGNTFNGLSQLVQTTAGGVLPAISGVNLTNLNASNLTSGTVGDARLSSNVTIQGNTFNVANQLVQLDGSGALPILSGSNLTNLNASNIASGTLNDSRLSNNITIQGNTFNLPSKLVQLNVSGELPVLSGANLTNLDASSLTSGTVVDGRLSANVALLNANQTFTGNNTFTGTITANTIQPSASMVIGAAGQSLTLQGNLSTKLTANNAGNVVAVGFTGTPTGNVNYNFDAATTPGTYGICTTVGNCASAGGGVTTLGGTTNKLTKFTGAQSVGDSSISDTGSVVSVAANSLFQAGSNSTSAFQIQNAAGTSNLFVADTTNNRIAIGQATANYPLDVVGDINSSTGLRVGGNLVCNSTGCAATSSSGFYIQNGVGLQTGANFNIESSSTGSIAGILKGKFGQTADIFRIVHGSGLVNLLTVAADGSTTINANPSTSALVVTGNSAENVLRVDSLNNKVIIGNSDPYGLMFKNVINGSNQNGTLALNSTSPGDYALAVGYGGTNTIRSYITGSGAGYFGPTNSTSAFQIQNSGGTSNLFVADTSNTRIGIGKASPGYTLDVNGDINIASGSAYRINGVAICGPTATCAPDSGSSSYVQNSTSLQAATNYYIQSASASSVGGIIRGATAQSASLFEARDGSNNTVLSISPSAVLTVGNQSVYDGKIVLNNASNAFTTTLQVATPSANRILTLPNETGTICVQSSVNCGFALSSGSGNYIQNGTSTQTANLNIQSAAAGSVGAVVQGASSQSADILQAKNSGGTVIANIDASGNINTTGQYRVSGVQISSANLSNDANLAKLNGTQSFTGGNTFTGQVTQTNTSNSTSAFRIQNAASTTDVLRADTTNARIGIGYGTGVAPSYTLDVNGDINASTSLKVGGNTVCTSTGCSASATSVIQNGTSTQTGANFNIQSAAAGSVTAVIQGAGAQTADILQVKDGSSQANTILAVNQTTSNLIAANSSFETNTTGWTQKGSATLTRITSEKYIGNASMQVVTSANANDGASFALTTSTLATSTSFSLSFYVKTLSTSVSTFQIGRSEDGTDVSCATGQSANSIGWTRVTCTFVTGVTSGTPNIYIKQTDATARTFYIDAVQLEPFSNLLTNSNFETNTTGWAARGSSTLTQISTNSQDGASSMQVATTALANDGAKSNVALSSNTKYTFTFYARLSSGTFTDMDIGRSEDGSTETSCLGTTQTVVTTGFTKYNCTFTTGTVSGTTYVYLKQVGATARNIWVDGVQLYVGNNISPAFQPLLSNPGFESTSVAGWVAKNGSAVSRTTTAGEFNTGAAGLKVITTVAVGDGVKSNFTLSSNTTYTFTLSAKLSSGTFTTMEMGRSEDGSTDTSCLTAQTVVTGSFTQYSCTFTTGTVSGTTYLYLKGTTGAIRTIFIDTTQIYAQTNDPVNAFQAGQIQLNGNITSPVALINQTNSTTAFQIQNASGASLFNVDTANTQIQVNGGYAADISSWSTNTNTLATSVFGSATAVLNGYIYSISGCNASGAYLAQFCGYGGIQYAKLNADGSVGSFSTATATVDATSANSAAQSAVVVNGRIYVGFGNSGVVSSFRPNADGSVSSVRSELTVNPGCGGGYYPYQEMYAANGYIYLTGTTNINRTTQCRLTVNPVDGTLSGATSATSHTNSSLGTVSVVANGYVYHIGSGDSACGSTTNKIYSMSINSNGTLGADTELTNTPLPVALTNVGAVYANGYIYVMGGGTTNCGVASSNVYYAKVNNNGTLGSWNTSAYTLPGARSLIQPQVANGRIYLLGGSSGGTGTVTNTIYYAGLPKLSVNANLDLVGGYTGSAESLKDAVSLGQQGGTITAGSVNAIGDITGYGGLNITGYSSLNGGVGISGATTIQSGTAGYNGSLLQVASNNTQNTNVFNVSTNNSTNLLTNPSFENSTTGWSSEVGNCGFAIDTAASLSGSYSLNVCKNFSGTGVNTNVTLSNSTTYALSVYVKGQATNTTFYMGVRWNNASDADCVTGQTYTSTGWTRFTCTFTTGTVAGSPYVYFRVTTGCCDAWYMDAAQLEVGSAATPFNMGNISLNGRVTSLLNVTGSVLQQNASNTSDAFQIKNASANNFFTVDTLNNIIGLGTSTDAVTLNIGTGITGVKTINIGNGASVANTIAIGGTGANVITIGDTQTGGSISLGAAMTTGTISIGGTGAQTGTISIGTGTGAQSINIGTGGTGVKTIGIGTGAVANAITIGSNTTTAGITFKVGATATNGISVNTGMTSGTQTLFNFTDGSAQALGSISVDTTANSTTYNTTSDARLKENITATHYSLDDLLKINVADYNFITDPTHRTQTGFLAQDLYSIFADAVKVGGEDANTDPWAVDYGRITPLLVKSIQDLNGKLENLSQSVSASQISAAIWSGGIVMQPTEFKNTVTFDALAQFNGIVRFQGDVQFNGRVEFADKDMAGKATILAATKTVHITFVRPYLKAPVVTLTPQDENISSYAVKNITTDGFDITLSANTNRDTDFNWIAILVKD